MAKSKVLMRVASKSSNDRSQESTEPAARPRTSAGEKGLLRRLRIGRMFLGLGSGAGSNQDRLPSAGASTDTGTGTGTGVDAGAGLDFGTAPIASATGLAGTSGPASNREMQPLHRLFRTSSAQLRQTRDDLVSDMHQTPLPREPLLRSTAHGLFGVAYSSPTQSSCEREGRRFAGYSAQQAEARKSHYSVLSRRSSAPDITEAVRRLSRHADTDEIDIISSDLPDHLALSDKDAGLTAASDPNESLLKSSSSGASHAANTAKTSGDSGRQNNSSGSSATFSSVAQ
ncbi:hypothetical protein LPJ64_000130, partial [Coemansia asiatica]